MLILLHHPRNIHDVFTGQYLGDGSPPQIGLKCTIKLLYFIFLRLATFGLLHISPHQTFLATLLMTESNYQRK